MCLWGQLIQDIAVQCLIRQFHSPGGPASFRGTSAVGSQAIPCFCGASCLRGQRSNTCEGNSMLLRGQPQERGKSMEYVRQFHAPAGPALFRRYFVSASKAWITAYRAPGPPCSCGASIARLPQQSNSMGNSMLLWGQRRVSSLRRSDNGQFHAPVGPALFRRYVLSPSLTWITAFERLGLLAPDPGLPGGPGIPRAAAVEVACAFAGTLVPAGQRCRLPFCSVGPGGSAGALAELSGPWASILLGYCRIRLSW